MRYDLTVITPTSDRPVGIRLAERWMARQDFAGSVQWIVADDGTEPAPLTMGQVHARRERSPDDTGATSLGKNLLAGLEHVEGRYVVIWEDDDCYKPGHLSDLCGRLDHGHVATGDDKQRYYNVRLRKWKLFHNYGSSLCQTAIRSSEVDRFVGVINEQMARNSYGFDYALWRSLYESGESVDVFDGDATHSANVVGIKGLPGIAGNGVGHRPDASWHDDADLRHLRQWAGEDADTYAEFYDPCG